MNRKTVNEEQKLWKSSSRYRRESDSVENREKQRERDIFRRTQHAWVAMQAQSSTRTHINRHIHAPSSNPPAIYSYTQTHIIEAPVWTQWKYRAGEESICDTYGTEQTLQRPDQEKLRVKQQEKASATTGVCVCVYEANVQYVCIYATCGKLNCSVFVLF